MQPPAAHSGREQHVIASSKTSGWQQPLPVHQSYRFVFILKKDIDGKVFFEC